MGFNSINVYMDPLASSLQRPGTQIAYTLGSMYLYREYCKAEVYTNWAYGPLYPKPLKLRLPAPATSRTHGHNDFCDFAVISAVTLSVVLL